MRSNTKKIPRQILNGHPTFDQRSKRRLVIYVTRIPRHEHARECAKHLFTVRCEKPLLKSQNVCSNFYSKRALHFLFVLRWRQTLEKTEICSGAVNTRNPKTIGSLWISFNLKAVNTRTDLRRRTRVQPQQIVNKVNVLRIRDRLARPVLIADSPNGVGRFCFAGIAPSADLKLRHAFALSARRSGPSSFFSRD